MNTMAKLVWNGSVAMQGNAPNADGISETDVIGFL